METAVFYNSKSLFQQAWFWFGWRKVEQKEKRRLTKTNKTMQYYLTTRQNMTVAVGSMFFVFSSGKTNRVGYVCLHTSRSKSEGIVVWMKNRYPCKNEIVGKDWKITKRKLYRIVWAVLCVKLIQGQGYFKHL